MIKEFVSRKGRRHKYRAQAMVEFAIALPVLLALLVGIMEVGRMVLMYTLVVNASRDAVRYAASVGIDSTSAPYARYAYCAGIKKTAKDSGYFLNLQDSDITISYDDGTNLPNGTPNSLVSGGCNATSGEDLDVVNADISSGDRVTVKVTKLYTPLVTLLPIQPRNITSISSRTLLGIFKLDN